MPLQSDRVAAKVATIVLAIAAMMLAAPGSRADDVAVYPNQPIRVVIGFSAGSSVDVSARIIGEKLAETWKQPVVAVNRAGAGGAIAAQSVPRRPQMATRC